jgi:serine/threonine-protein kinase RsbW
MSWVNDRPEPPDITGLRPNEIELRMLAHRERVPAIRALATDMAMRADHDLDSIGTLRLMVEEVCITLLANAGQDSVLVFRLRVSPSGVEITASVPTPDGQPPTVRPLNLRILRAMSDSVDFWTTGEEPRQFHVQLTKSVA